MLIYGRCDTMQSYARIGQDYLAKLLYANYAENPFYSIPGSVGVTLVGHGYQVEDHYGLKDVTLRAMSHTNYHAEPLSTEEIENGQARLNTFHFDGIVYGAHPSRVKTF